MSLPLLSAPTRWLGAIFLVLGLGVMSTPVIAQDGGAAGYELAISALQCEGPTTSDAPCAPLDGVSIVVTIDGLDRVETCQTGLTDELAVCTVLIPFESSVTVNIDPATVPAGYDVVNPNGEETAPPAPTQRPADQAVDYGFVVIPADDLAAQREYNEENQRVQNEALASASAAADVPADDTTTEPGSAGTGSPALIFAGSCETDLAESEPVATLSETTVPTGEQRGSETGIIETSFTTLDLPLDDIISEDHVLVVFDEDDRETPLVCGAIGGVVTEDGTLVFGLPAVGESRFSGIAYLTENGQQTQATVFIAEDLTAAAPAA